MFFTTSGKEALEVLQQNGVHVIIVDMRMPEMSGLDFLKVIKEEYPHIVRMVLSGYAQVTPLLTAINERKIFKYITKPWDSDDELKVAIREAIDCYNSEHEMVVAEEIDAIKNEVDKFSEICTGPSRLDEQQAEPLGVQDSEEVIEWSELVSRGMNEEILKEVVPVFLADKKERLNKLAEAVETGDAKEVELYAHAIKGGAGNVGAKKLSEAAFNLEHMASQEDLSNAGELLERIKTEFEKFELFVSQPNWVEIAKQQTDNNKEKQPC